MDKDLGIPVMYDLYPGSITDVTTLTGTLRKLAAYGVNDYIAIHRRQVKVRAPTLHTIF